MHTYIYGESVGHLLSVEQVQVLKWSVGVTPMCHVPLSSVVGGIQ